MSLVATHTLGRAPPTTAHDCRLALAVEQAVVTRTSMTQGVGRERYRGLSRVEESPPPPLALRQRERFQQPPLRTCAEPQSFGSGAQLQAAFAAGTLHPGGLKPAVRDAVEAVLQRVRAHVQADKELAAAEKEMQKVHKRMTSKK